MKKLYVGNLSFKATEEQVQALFAEIGVQPDSLTLLRDRFTGNRAVSVSPRFMTTPRRKRRLQPSTAKISLAARW